MPRTQKLRKIARLLAPEAPTAIDEQFFNDVVTLLITDTAFSPTIHAALCKVKETGALLRNINTVYHILLAETGQPPADWDFVDRCGCLDPAKRRCFPGMQIYLEDIRSPYNIGAIFRAAESFGVERLWLSPLCADPLHTRSLRTAMGCIEVLPWDRIDLETLLSTSGLPVFALETGGHPLADFTFPQHGIFIIGSEELGVSPESLRLAAASMGNVSLSTYGAKGSLNVAVAFGIACHAWANTLIRVQLTMKS
ncbi:TrmH family RNA methyltransferase [Breznakiellaceae bacterium SP9]